MEEKVISKRAVEFPKRIDIIQTIIIFMVSLLIPTFLGEFLKSTFATNSILVTQSQLIIGSIVNTALIMSALNLKGWRNILGVVTMPNIATILGGYVFQSSSVYMVYMIPAIWIGNLALIYSYKFIMLAKKKNYFVAGIIGIIAKVLIIYGSFSLLKICGVFPDKLVTALQVAMSSTQAITALIGMMISFGLYKIELKKD